MANAQKWLDEKYPQEKRTNIKNLDISNKNLEGSLKLEGFDNLEKLDCSNNLITKLKLGSEKITKLDVSNNNFDKQDLTCFRHLVRLKRLYLGTTDRGKIQQNLYNCFTGSLEPLKKLDKLKELAISNTNISSGLEHLPDSLEKIYCTNYLGENVGCEKIREELKDCFNRSKQYYDLQIWRRVQKAMTKEVGFPLLYTSSINTLKKAQKWLDQKYPEKEERRRCIQLDISFPSLRIGLEGALDLKDFKGVRLLNCSGHKITGLELGKYPQLEHFYCDTNQLTSLNINDYPELTKIDCSKNQLNELTITNCPQLAELYCSNNFVSNFNFNELEINKNKLTCLDLKNNRLFPLDLSVLSSFVNLELVDIGSNNREKISKGFYNQFSGSLKSLKNMNKLKFLNIEATDIDSGLEYLPKSLEEFYCTSYGTWTKVGKIEEILRDYVDPSQAQQLSSSSSQYQNISVTNFSPNYFENLQRWRKSKGIEINNNEELFDSDEGSPVSQSFGYESNSNQPVTRTELFERLINEAKTKLNTDLQLSLETLLDAQSEIIKGNDTFEIRQLKRKAKEKLLGSDLSTEEIENLCRLQSELVQWEEQEAQVEVNPNNFGSK